MTWKTDSLAGKPACILYCLLALGLFVEMDGLNADNGIDELLLAQVTQLASTDVARIGTAVEPGSYQESLVALTVDGEAVGDFVFLQRNGQWFLPLGEVAQHLDLGFHTDNESLVLETPQGGFQVAVSDLIRRQSEIYIVDQALRDRLSFEIRFDPSSYTLAVLLPWSSDGEPLSQAERPLAEVSPPRFTLGQARTDFYYTDMETGDPVLRSVQQLRGGLADGAWQIQYGREDNGLSHLDEYYWVRADDHSQQLAGRGVIAPNNLIPATEITGLQWAWSNRALDRRQQRDPDLNSFYRAVGSAPRRIQGRSEPGAIAELWMDGQTIGVTRVLLDGSYEFPEVNLASQQYNRVEVRIYDRQRGALLDRIDHSTLGSETLLSAGQTVVYAGAGAPGNLLDANGPDLKQNFAGTLLFRQGVSDRLTLDGGISETLNGQFQSLGFSALLGSRMSLYGTLAAQGGDTGWLLESMSRGDKWQFLASARESSAGFRSAESPREYFRFMDFQQQLGDHLQWYIQGRQTNHKGSGQASYLLPGVGWYQRQWGLRLMPAYDGGYRLDAQWNGRRFRSLVQLDRFQRFVSSRYDWRPDLQLVGNLRQGDNLPARAELGVEWYPDNFSDRSSEARFSLLAGQGGKYGYSASWQTTLLPGLFGDLQLVRDPAESSPDGKIRTRLQLQVTLDLAFNGRRLMPAESRHFSVGSGSLSGRLEVSGMPGSELEEIKHIAIKINEVPTDVPLRNGYFFLDNLPDGTHLVELDSGNLPIEWSPVTSRRWVRIAPGATTSMNFAMELRLGFSGKVVDETGGPISERLVTVVNQATGQAYTARTSQFGFYRIDGLPPGEYMAGVPGQDGEMITVRPVSLTTKYLFGQDLALTIQT